jgi:hypothetical protein
MRTLVALLLCSAMVVGYLAAAPVGAVKGYVKDSTGAIVPDATAVLASEDTHLSQRARADEAGYFQFLQLPPGRYQLTVEASGFRKTSIRDILVLVDQIVSLDVQLEVGQITEVVEVAGGVVSLIEPEKSSTGVVMDLTLVKNLPQAGRQFLDLARLAPGVVLDAPGTQAGGFSAVGQRAQSNNFLLDGINNIDPQVNGPLNSFRIADAVQEFSVTTTVASAEFGRGSGAQVNIVTKSGANQFHGTAFWLHRNDALDARDFFTNKFGGTKNVLRRHQYGATLGGPIRRDRTFFFYSWERFWQKNPSPTTAVVPSATERDAVRDPISRVLLQFWPLPTDPNAAAGATNFVGNVPRSTFDNTHLMRIDHSWNEKARLTGRYIWSGGTNTLGGTVPTSGGRDNEPGSQSLVLTESHLFSPTLFTEIRLGYSRNQTRFTVQDHGFNAAPLFPGVPGVVDTTKAGVENSGLPRVSISSYAAIGSATNMPQGRITNTYELIGNLTKIAPFGLSRHTTKFGFYVRRDEARRYLNSNMRGFFSFSTFADFAGTCAACGSRALINSATIRTGNTLGHWYRYPWAFYIQDDIKVKPNLTLNMGLRYELPSAVVEKNNRATNFVEGVGPILVGTNQVLDIDTSKAGPASIIRREAPFLLPRSGTTTDRNNFAPVFGFAYSPLFGPGPLGDHKTVIRGGFRVSFDDIFNNIPVNQTLNVPWALTTTQRAGTTQPVSGFPWDVAFDQNVPLVARTTQAPGLPALGLIGFNAYDNHARSSYAYNWNLGIQRELGGKASVDISYVGSAGHKLGMFVNANEPDVVIRDPGFRAVQRPNEQFFPYPRWSSVSLGTFQSNSVYHGMVAAWKMRWQGLLNLGGSYTLGHGIDNNSSFFGSDDDDGSPNTRKRLDLERSNSANDQRHRFISYYVLELPFGRGRRFLGGSNRVFDSIAGGWQLSGIVNMFSGQPFTVFANTSRDFSGFNNFNDRPDITGRGPLTLNRGDSDNFFDPAYFGKVGTEICPGYSTASGNRVTTGCAPPGRVGASPRNGFYGPGLISFDLSASKKFQIAERLVLRYQADFFNVANHTNFGVRVGNRSMNSGEFGKLTTTSEHIYGGPRIIQMTLRIEF